MLGGMLLLSGAPNLSIVRPGAFSISIVVPFLNMTKTVLPAISARCPIRSTPLSWALRAQSASSTCWTKQPETDDGYVTLVNAKEENGATGRMRGAHRHLGLEASAQRDGTVTYTRLTGDVRLYDVDFGYEAG